MKGIPHTEEYRRNQSQALRGRKKPIEAVISRMTVWNIARSLVLRGAIPAEIGDLTELSVRQAQNATNRPRLLFADEDYENRKAERRRRADRARARRRERLISESEQNSIAFARMLIEEGIIADDLSSWIQLKELYQESRIELPYSFSDRLRLEAFFKARRVLETEGRQDLLQRYMETGELIEVDWFNQHLADEEDFIARTLVARIHNADGEDGRGLYRYDRNGFRWYQPIGTDDEGNLLFDNSTLARRRRVSRERS